MREVHPKAVPVTIQMPTREEASNGTKIRELSEDVAEKKSRKRRVQKQKVEEPEADFGELFADG